MDVIRLLPRSSKLVGLKVLISRALKWPIGIRDNSLTITER